MQGLPPGRRGRAVAHGAGAEWDHRRPRGAVEDFSYSSALEDAAADGLVWTEENLAAFLAKPREFMKGTRMSFAGLRRDTEIADVIAYLATQD